MCITSDIGALNKGDRSCSWTKVQLFRGFRRLWHNRSIGISRVYPRRRNGYSVLQVLDRRLRVCVMIFQDWRQVLMVGHCLDDLGVFLVQSQCGWVFLGVLQQIVMWMYLEHVKLGIAFLVCCCYAGEILLMFLITGETIPLIKGSPVTAQVWWGATVTHSSFKPYCVTLPRHAVWIRCPVTYLLNSIHTCMHRYPCTCVLIHGDVNSI